MTIENLNVYSARLLPEKDYFCSGHRACQGCAEALAVRMVHKVLGRNTILETDLFSVCLAVQNLWLAARAEGVGVGWVSVLDQAQLAEVLKLPSDVYPVAYLCLGYVSEFLSQPELEAEGWRSRLPLPDLLHGDVWGGAPEGALVDAVLKGSKE